MRLTTTIYTIRLVAAREESLPLSCLGGTLIRWWFWCIGAYGRSAMHESSTASHWPRLEWWTRSLRSWDPGGRQGVLLPPQPSSWLLLLVLWCCCVSVACVATASCWCSRGCGVVCLRCLATTLCYSFACLYPWVAASQMFSPILIKIGLSPSTILPYATHPTNG